VDETNSADTDFGALLDQPGQSLRFGRHNEKLQPDLRFVPGRFLCQFQIASQSVDSYHPSPPCSALPIHHPQSLANLQAAGPEEMAVSIAIDLHLGPVQFLGRQKQ
jgi:hypothetical protein